MKNMIVMLLAILNINATTNANRVIFYFKKLPLIGKLMPDKIYGDSELKMIATVVVTLLNVIRKLIGKTMYIVILIVLPLVFFYKEESLSIQPEAFINVFFFLSFIAGTIQVSALLETNRNKYLCIKLMKFGARDFVIPTLFARHITNLIYYLPTILIPYALIGGSALQGFLLLILLTAFRFIGEAGQLLLFHKKNILLIKNYKTQWIFIILSCLAAYTPLYFMIIWPITQFLFGLPVVMLLIFGAISCTLYILHFRDYKRVIYASINLDEIMLDIGKAKRDAMFKSVRLKESEFTEESLHSNKYMNKKGYEYLNAIFFDRHRKLLEKPIMIRIGIIAAVLLLSIVAVFLFPDIKGEINSRLLSTLPAFVFIMYFSSLGDRICKAMFFNCDISLLRYGFYRKKDVILKNFLVRLKKVTYLNMIVGIAICVALYAFIIIEGVSYYGLDLLLFSVSILCLSVFFSVHHLFMYYVFQPYTTELGMKNPFFSIVNFIVYILCYGCLQLRNVPGFFTIAVIGATLTYIGVAMVLVYRLAPQNFRVK